MKKLISKSKKVVAVFLLAIMVVCAVAPSVQAYSFPKKDGSRGNDGGYYSITTITAYTDTGYAARATAGAKMPTTEWAYKSNNLTASVISSKTTTYGDAWHSYGVNGITYGTWMEN